MKRFVGPLLGFVAGALLGAVVAGQLLATQLRSTLSEYAEILQYLERHRAERDLALLVSLQQGATDEAVAALEGRIDGHIERLEQRPEAEVAETLAELRAYREGRPPPPPAAASEASSAIVRLLATARVLPVFESGEMVGLRVSHIAPDGPMAAFGVREGDVIVRIGETALDSPAASVALLGALAEAEDVDLRRVAEGRIELIPR